MVLSAGIWIWIQDYLPLKLGLQVHFVPKPDVVAKFITRENILVRIYKKQPNDRSGMLELNVEEYI